MPRQRRHTLRIALAGGVTVALHREDGAWYATALEFNITGYGDTRTKAIAMLRELIAAYMVDVATLLAEGKKVRFFHPSGEEVWNRAEDLRKFQVTFVIQSSAKAVEDRIDNRNLGKLIAFIDSLDDMGVELVPAD